MVELLLLLLLLLLLEVVVFVMTLTEYQVLSYATIVRYLVYQQGKEIDLLVGTLRDHNIGTFTRRAPKQHIFITKTQPVTFLPACAHVASTPRCKMPST